MTEKKAFTLLEVMIALAIIAIAVSSVLTSLAAGASIPYDSKKRIKAVDLAVLKLHEIERKLKKDGFKDDDEEEHGDFEDKEFENFHWIARIKKIEIPDDIAMLAKMFTGDAEDGGNARMKGMAGLIGGYIQTLKDTFEKSIREIEIEVYWYYGGEEEENREKFILVTHLIDFTKVKGM